MPGHALLTEPVRAATPPLPPAPAATRTGAVATVTRTGPRALDRWKPIPGAGTPSRLRIATGTRAPAALSKPWASGKSLKPRALGADTGYDDGEFFVDLALQKITPHVPAKSGEIKSRDERGNAPQSTSTHGEDPVRDQPACPQANRTDLRMEEVGDGARTNAIHRTQADLDGCADERRVSRARRPTSIAPDIKNRMGCTRSRRSAH